MHKLLEGILRHKGAMKINNPLTLHLKKYAEINFTQLNKYPIKKKVYLIIRTVGYKRFVGKHFYQLNKWDEIEIIIC